MDGDFASSPGHRRGRGRQGGPGADLESHSNLYSLTLAPSLRWIMGLSLQEGNGFCWEPTEPLSGFGSSLSSPPTCLHCGRDSTGSLVWLSIASVRSLNGEGNIVADPKCLFSTATFLCKKECQDLIGHRIPSAYSALQITITIIESHTRHGDTGV